MSSVLIIDDAAASRVMLRHQLAKLGHEVIEAGSGQQALEALEGQTVDVVISDQEMPGMTGLELRSRLGSSFTKPFVLLTGYVTETEIDAKPDISPDAIITKPASSTVLASTLQELGIQAPSQVSG